MNKTNTFASLPVGTHFRWMSNHGAGDTLEKISPSSYKNITTTSTKIRLLNESIFGKNDLVIVVKQISTQTPATYET